MSILTINLDNPSLTDRKLNDGTELGAVRLELAQQYATIHSDLEARRGEWPLGWLDLPWGGEMALKAEELGGAYARQFSDLIVCGIGGSALGTQAVYAALDRPDAPLRRLEVVDNVDPAQLSWISMRLMTSNPAVNVISKSGGTLETMSGFFYLLKLLELTKGGPERITDRIIATTDAERGLLRELALKRGWDTLPVPGDVGGRFSVLTPVGLFPLAFAGVDIAALLGGAREMQEQCLNQPVAQNPAFMLAATHYLLSTRGGINQTLQYIYGDPLMLLGDWFRQLWAESLSKAQKLDGTTGSGECMTPLVARGSTDQHSQNQLYMEGADDRLYGFVAAEQWFNDPLVELAEDADHGKLGYMDRRRFSDLLNACCHGTRDALLEAGRPVYEITFPEVSARTIGAFLQLWMLATAYAGLLYNVNAFDQPGVERSKQITKDVLAK
jgi:glucose-6-phosphate isomerase